MSKLVRVNLGCSYSPLPGWLNCDNSVTLRLARVPLLPVALQKLGLVSRSRWESMQMLRREGVMYIDALRRLPFHDSSVDVIYTSHMINCFDRDDARRFLLEARRVLKRGGIIRIAVPDLRRKVSAYLESADADAFIDSIYARRLNPKGISQRLTAFLTGYKLYLAQDDAQSLGRLLRDVGFLDPTELPPGHTKISEPSGLDLAEHEAESLYMEAHKG